jgi:hypothetical protein
MAVISIKKVRIAKNEAAILKTTSFCWYLHTIYILKIPPTAIIL